MTFRLAGDGPAASLSAMLKSAALLVMLVAAPAFAEEGRTDLATLKQLVAQTSAAIGKRTPSQAALLVAQPSLSDEIAQALRAPRENRLKVAPR
jgi:hypothetical protein